MLNNRLQYIPIEAYTTESGFQLHDFQLSYQLFGPKLKTAPVVMVNHALSGNSNVCGKDGWWKDLIGTNKAIDTNKYTVLAFNIPGNGYDGFLIDRYDAFVARDIARIFLKGLKALGISKLHSIIGGSLGGGIAWEMACLVPDITTHLIPIASDWKSTDWLIANCRIQEQILLHSSKPVHDARMHAMLCYRTPASFKQRFQRTIHKELEIFNVESWLLHHGKKLEERFQKKAYLLMNHLLKHIDVGMGNQANTVLKKIKAQVHVIAVDTDIFFTAQENKETYEALKEDVQISYHEIRSIHGHDAFLIEYEQLKECIAPIYT
jgi:homoserine O-acetyltransferase